ncbi:hypothetical protein T08_12957 [Trichinella sp. T8]|nr:hypothetical protein T08_12957 [Trichinella sp. T8]
MATSSFRQLRQHEAWAAHTEHHVSTSTPRRIPPTFLRTAGSASVSGRGDRRLALMPLSRDHFPDWKRRCRRPDGVHVGCESAGSAYSGCHPVVEPDNLWRNGSVRHTRSTFVRAALLDSALRAPGRLSTCSARPRVVHQ